MQSIYVYGASGHGLVVSDVARACGYKDIIFIDDGENSYLSFEDIIENKNIPIGLGVGSNSIRAKLFEKAKNNGFTVSTLIHPSSIISPSVTIEEGTLVMPNVVVNSKATIGVGVILNTSCVIEHECIIQNFVHISPGVTLAGNVEVGELTHLGIQSCVIQGLSIGKNCIIGAGSVVTKNISNNKLSYGNPCNVIKDINE